MVILYYGTHSFRIIDVPGCNDMLPTSLTELALQSTGSWRKSKLVAESSEFHLTLRRERRAHFSQLEIRKKRDILSEKRESGMALKSLSLRPKAVMLTPMT